MKTHAESPLWRNALRQPTIEKSTISDDLNYLKYEHEERERAFSCRMAKAESDHWQKATDRLVLSYDLKAKAEALYADKNPMVYRSEIRVLSDQLGTLVKALAKEQVSVKAWTDRFGKSVKFYKDLQGMCGLQYFPDGTLTGWVYTQTDDDDFKRKQVSTSVRCSTDDECLWMCAVHLPTLKAIVQTYPQTAKTGIVLRLNYQPLVQRLAIRDAGNRTRLVIQDMTDLPYCL